MKFSCSHPKKTFAGLGVVTGLALLSPLARCAVPAPTFSKDIAPVIFQNCTECHRPGEAAPFTFTSYREVQKRGKLIVDVVGKGYMPPWHVQSKDYHFQGARGLSEAQRDLLARWVEAGMPEGDPAQTPALPAFVQGWQLGEPDLVIRMPAGYTVPADGPDIYRNFVIPLNLPEDKWVLAIEFRPGEPSVVHHSLFYYDTTGAAREMDAEDPVPGFRRMGQGIQRNGGLGGWAVGGTPKRLPDGLAYKLPKGADLILSTHFHPSGKPETEVSTLGLYFADAPPKQGFTGVQLPPAFGALAGVDIPPGETDYTKRDHFVLPVDVKAFGVSAHAHYLGKSMRMTATLPSGEVRELLNIPKWDFSWQEQYQYEDTVFLPAGTRLDGVVVWDNSTNNVFNPSHPPERVRWGRESTDEMGSVTLLMVAAKPSELNRLTTAYRKKVREEASNMVADRFSGGRDGERGNLLKRLVERFDKDGDGKLNAEEQAEAKKAFRGRRL